MCFKRLEQLEQEGTSCVETSFLNWPILAFASFNYNLIELQLSQEICSLIA
jgi:hypothetical protein